MTPVAELQKQTKEGSKKLRATILQLCHIIFLNPQRQKLGISNEFREGVGKICPKIICLAINDKNLFNIVNICFSNQDLQVRRRTEKVLQCGRTVY